MAEERFLASRQERLEARGARAVGTSEAFVARQRFLDDFAAQRSAVAALVAAGSADEARAEWRRLQALLQGAGETVELPAHDQRASNAALAELDAAIDALRPKTKKFTFSSKPKAAAAATTASPPPQDDPAATVVPAAAAAKAEDDAPVPQGGAVYADRDGATLFVPTADAVFLRRLTNCTVLLLPTRGSVFLSDCRGCRVYACCRQLRVKSTADSELYVWAASTPVIESSSGIRFGGYAAWRGLLASAPAAQLHGDAAEEPLATHEAWAQRVGGLTDMAHARRAHTIVDDFHWIKQTASPNWRALPEEEWTVNDAVFVAAGECEGEPKKE